jgi:hypothetical protein
MTGPAGNAVRGLGTETASRLDGRSASRTWGKTRDAMVRTSNAERPSSAAGMRFRTREGLSEIHVAGVEHHAQAAETDTGSAVDRPVAR